MLFHYVNFPYICNMLLKDFLKAQGLFSNEINARLKNGQIKVNGEQVKTNIDLPITNNLDDMEDVVSDLGDFLFWNICSNQIWIERLRVFNIEFLIGSNIQNDLTEFLKNFIIIRISKTQAFVVCIA